MLAWVVAAAVVRRSAAYLLEHLSWDGDLRHLEDDIASVAHHLRADLEQLLLQARQRQVLDSAPVLQACGESCQEIVGERMKLEPHGVGPRTCHLIAPLPSLIQLIIRLSKCSWSLHLRLRLSRTRRSAGASILPAVRSAIRSSVCDC